MKTITMPEKGDLVYIVSQRSRADMRAAAIANAEDETPILVSVSPLVWQVHLQVGEGVDMDEQVELDAHNHWINWR